jgi:hypothetical protein
VTIPNFNTSPFGIDIPQSVLLSLKVFAACVKIFPVRFQILNLQFFYDFAINDFASSSAFPCPLCVSAIKLPPLGFWSLDFDLSPSVFISGGRSR